jgi:phage terminase small subunit
VLEGDPKKCRYNLNEPKSDDLDPVDIPEKVQRDPAALEMWTRLAPKMINMGTLRDVDYYALQNLCVHYGMWYLKPSVQMTTRLNALLCEFGLTPSSRTRLVGNLPHEDAPEDLLAPRRKAK